MFPAVNRFLLLVASLVLLTHPQASDFAVAVAGPNSLTGAERAAGWRLLFDGRTTQGWRGFKQVSFPTTGWSVENGCLLHRSHGGGGDIVTDEVFDEFELQFEWKLSPGSNSCLKYFILEERREAIGREYQVIDDAAYGFDKTGNKYQTASFYDVLAPPTYVPPRPPGQFNVSRILVRGAHVEHWLNGTKVIEYELGSPEVMRAVSRSKFRDVPGFGTRLKGHLLLQDHGGEVWFRNLKIRTPPPAPNEER